jgi:hypothetical protein
VLLLLLLLNDDWIDSRVPSGRQANKLKICKLEGRIDRGGRVVQYLHKSMPHVVEDPPEIDSKSMIRRVQRGRRFMRYEQVEMLPQALKALRKLSTGLMCDFEASIDPEERIKLATAYAKLSEQRRILLRIPGPPTGGSTKTATPAPITAQILDAEPIEHVSTENPPLAAE